MTYKIGDKVTSPINDRFGGIVTGVIKACGREYYVSYFNNDGVAVSSRFDECELEPAKENGGMGFNRERE